MNGQKNKPTVDVKQIRKDREKSVDSGKIVKK